MKFTTTTALFSLAFFFQVTEAFFATKSAPSKVSSLATEAVEVYNQKYPFNRERGNKPNPLGTLGVPKNDFDGTVLVRDKSTGPVRKSLADITEKQAISNFNALATVYGEDRALGMVKTEALSLAFDSSDYAETFSIWAEKFGEEETKEMVLRNPGLLSVKPVYAKKTDDSTMAFSYIIATTRPIGAAGPVLLLLLVLTPVIEAVTGIPIKETREAFFANLF
mmetsp:Transcript_5893/g.13985  ORF Transcript_5893/g.13985 Transcript_5893/m.13985 type:complete len:222 (+) Transcript_5893:170-835(+)